MARPCAVCTHPERLAIEKALLAGEPNRRVATRYDAVSEASIRRHMKGHFSRDVAQSIEVVPIEESDGVFAEMQELKDHVYGHLSTLQGALEQVTDPELKLKLASAVTGALREARGSFDSRLKVVAEGRMQGEVDIRKNPDFIKFQSIIAAVFRRFPGVIAAMREEAAKVDGELLVQGVEIGRNVTRQNKE